LCAVATPQQFEDWHKYLGWTEVNNLKHSAYNFRLASGEFIEHDIPIPVLLLFADDASCFKLFQPVPLKKLE